MKPEETRCIICNTVNNWENVDHLKEKPMGMSICRHCGFVTHMNSLTPKEEIKEYYKNSYRQPPTVGNFFTGQRKLYYHQAFLGPLFDEWGKEDRKPEIFESGTAYGLFIKWAKDYLKARGTEATVSGSEWTESFKRVCFHHHGIELQDEIDENKKYDLIASYKVLEHQVDADKELRKFVKLLKDDGLIYIGVPIWFKTMTNFGMNGFDIEYYYHKDHINVWNDRLFRTLLNKCGLEIIKENHVYYDSVFLCKRNDELMTKDLVRCDYKEIISDMERIKKAFEHFKKQEFKEACETYSNYPQAWIMNYEKNRNEFHKLGPNGIWENHSKLAMKACPGNAEIYLHVADIYARYDKFEEAIKYVDKGYELRPGSPDLLTARGQYLMSLAELAQDEKDSIALLKEARGTFYECARVSEQKKHEVITWIYKIESMIPMGA